MRHAFLVTADHVIPEWACKDHFINVYEDRCADGLIGYYADSPQYGCGKTYSTTAAAITEMLASHACTNIRITPLFSPALPYSGRRRKAR